MLAMGATAATINIQNNDGAGEGFNDPTAAAPVGGNPGVTIGQQRLNAFTYAANIWGACLQSAVPIIIRAQMDPLACTPTQAVLGSAGAFSVWRDFPGAPLPSTWYPAALANALFGADLDPTGPDINATFNSNLGNAGCLTGIFWYYGLDHNPPANTIDFVSVVLHEMGHGVGFQTFINAAGTRFLGFDDDYMVFLENHGATPFWFQQMSDAQRAAGQINDPFLHWLGPIVNNRALMQLSAGMNNGHTRMHGPNPYQGGSSTSHWSTALAPDELMEPFYTVANHEPGLAWALLDEIGWNLCSQPENGCNAAVVDLMSPTGTKSSATGVANSNQERGTYITVLKDFAVCSLGMEGDFVPGQTLTANIYAANGIARGALLATGSTTIKYDGLRVHYVPISFTLQKCKEYDVAIQFGTADSWPWWDETTMTQRPFDADGAIRVRDGERAGDPSNFALARFQLRGTTAAVELQSNFVVSATGAATIGPEHGAFMTALKTMSLSKLGLRVQYTSAPSVLRAYVYDSVGNARGNLIAEGLAAVPTTAGQVITVPINALLEEGKQYNIGFDFGTTSTRFIHIQATPYLFNDLFTVDSEELAGVANAAGQLPNFEITYSDGPGLNGLDITTPWFGPPPQTGSGGPFAFGKYVTALATQDLTGMGFLADIPPGNTVTCNVYNATGTTRGALISTGSINVVQGSMKWHDVPVSARLVGGQDYDLEITWTNSTAFKGWLGITSQPYNAYGILKIVVGEFGGTPDAAKECVQYRVYSCPVGTLTATNPRPTPKFALHDAFPNPFSGATTMGYELDEAASVTVQVYDVAGRRVADVMKSRAMPKGLGHFSIEANNLASGVYFVKMSTPAKSVTRKITILR
jgi:hypothetical protein